MPLSLPSIDPTIIRARTIDGNELPVIDITHPAFAVPDGPGAIDDLRRSYESTEHSQNRLMTMFGGIFLRLAARRSPLVASLVNPRAGFLSGLSTYLMKLGPDNLVPPFDGEIDQRLAASPPATSLRIRLQQTARLLAQGLEPHLASSRDAPLHILDIGGGPAVDALNALILLQQSRPYLLNRPIVVHVLDLDTEGPAFGEQALSALQREDGPLAGLGARFRHETYSWENPETLEALATRLDDEGAIVAASSEGALFEYAEDEVVVANLRAMRAGGVRLVTGSVTRADDLARRILAHSRYRLMPRGADGFVPLARAGGFILSRAESAVMSDQVLLAPVI